MQHIMTDKLPQSQQLSSYTNQQWHHQQSYQSQPVHHNTITQPQPKPKPKPKLYLLIITIGIVLITKYSLYQKTNPTNNDNQIVQVLTSVPIPVQVLEAGNDISNVSSSRGRSSSWVQGVVVEDWSHKQVWRMEMLELGKNYGRSINSGGLGKGDKWQIDGGWWALLQQLYGVQFQKQQQNISYQQMIQIDNKIRSTSPDQANITQAQLQAAQQQLKQFLSSPTLPTLSSPPTLSSSPSPSSTRFCLLVPTYNNHPDSRNTLNLQSILQQNYPNYRLLIIDDNSNDTNFDDITNYLKNNNIQYTTNQHVNVNRKSSRSNQGIGGRQWQQRELVKVWVIRNKERKMALRNLYQYGRMYCESTDVVGVVQGDDMLLGNHVLATVAAVFQQHQPNSKQAVWMLFTNFITNTGQLGYSRPYSNLTTKHNKYRIAPFTYSHARFYYNKLLHLIHPSSLQHQSSQSSPPQYFNSATDVALYMPMLQLCHSRVRYVPKIMYVYNRGTGQNNYQIKLEEQRYNQRIVRDKQVYPGLSRLFSQAELQYMQRKKQIARNHRNT